MKFQVMMLKLSNMRQKEAITPVDITLTTILGSSCCHRQSHHHACLTHASHFYNVPYNVILEMKPSNVFSKQNLTPSCIVLSMVNTVSELEINVGDKHR